jgi:hypothetical protein
MEASGHGGKKDYLFLRDKKYSMQSNLRRDSGLRRVGTGLHLLLHDVSPQHAVN